ncbi:MULTISPECIES: DUF4176 domain-containing protein [Bacillaceae]|uniref:DUF4176 domain-containing protein n=1 Tax=Bacillaceae TaxID=186817 RepID=UPI000BFDE849|nr:MULTISPECIES: DUF4176 domain-containing protein [Bacillaceae]PGT80390.1 hypothetical protein COD11_21280 [Bacillus sp. AFS040349]UGB31233.1 DUF4176 domain-containing protein [Metabacillus sp. B2-18]
MKSKFFFLFIILVLTLIGCSEQKASQKVESEKEEEQTESLDPAKLVPIGTVVKLKEMDKLVMVYGYNQIQTSTGKQFDYIAVPYPEGNISPDYNVFFNRNMIKDIIHSGYVTSEDKENRENADSEGHTY